MNFIDGPSGREQNNLQNPFSFRRVAVFWKWRRMTATALLVFVLSLASLFHSAHAAAAEGAPSAPRTCEAIERQVVKARTDLVERQARYDQARRAIEAPSRNRTIDFEWLAPLREREADIRRRQADVESRYGDAHPLVRSVRAERHDVEAQITAEFARAFTRLRNDVDVARAKLASLQQDLAACRVEHGASKAASRPLSRHKTTAMIDGVHAQLTDRQAGAVQRARGIIP